MTDQTLDDDFFDGATAAFPNVEHLAPSVPPNFGDGRLVAIWALSNGRGEGKNGPYDYTDTITLVLDDGLDGEQANDVVGPAPFRTPMRHSTGYIHAKIRDRVEGKHPKHGTPLRYRPYIGRVNTRVSAKSKNQPAFGISEMTDADRSIAMEHADLIRSINAEVEAADKDKQAADAPF